MILRVPTDMDRGLRLLPMCDVAVIPRPAAPGFPIKLLNYMAAKRPCVMYASSASRVAHGDHVWLAGEDTSESLGRAIEKMLKDSSLRARIGQGGYRFVREHHDRRHVAAHLCAAYMRVLEGSRRWEEIQSRPLVDLEGAGLDASGKDTGAGWNIERSDFAEAGIHASA